MFLGQFNHGVDDKGRVIIPNRLRASLGERFFMTRGIDGCVFVYPESEYQALTEKLNSKPQLDRKTLLLQRFFLGSEASVDGQGRVAIPSNLRGWAKIEEQGEVVIVGMGSRVEIWNKDSWSQYNDELTDSVISDAARDLGLEWHGV